ncbi:MAG: hypothetical protein ABJA98_12055 [Acidobacteriota bacterium]
MDHPARRVALHGAVRHLPRQYVIHGYEPTPAIVLKPSREAMIAAPQTEGAR